MKKVYFVMSMMVLLFVCSTITTSCSKDDSDSNDNQLLGWWMTTPYDAWGYDFCQALHFTSESTVEYYSYVANGRYWDSNSASFPGKSGWYYQDGCEGHYSYTIKGTILYMYGANDAKMIDMVNGTPKNYEKVK